MDYEKLQGRVNLFWLVLQDDKNILADKGQKSQILSFIGDKMKTLMPGQDKTSR